MTRFFFGAAVLFMLSQLFSCGSEEQDVVVHVHDATLKVRVYKLADGGGGNTIEVAIAGATVELYKSEGDRDLSLNEVIEHTTDADGNTTFVGLKEDYYYLRCTQPNYGNKLDEVSTPDGTISYVDFVY